MSERESRIYARVAQLVEHDLAKVGVAGSSPVSRSFYLAEMPINRHFRYFCVCSILKTLEDSVYNALVMRS